MPLLNSTGFWRSIAACTWIWACIRAWDEHAHWPNAPTRYAFWLILAPLIIGLPKIKNQILWVRLFATGIGFAFCGEIALFSAPRHSPITIGLGIVETVIHLWTTVILLSIPQSALPIRP